MLLGRAREIAALESAMGAALSSIASVRVISGPPGIGKTALLREIAARAIAWTLLRTGGHPDGGQIAYAGLRNLLAARDGSGVAGHVVNDARFAWDAALGAGRSPASDVRRVETALLHRLAVMAEQSPTLILVDDFSWLDPLSASALLFVARRLARERIAMILCVRSAADHPLSSAEFEVVTPAPLDDDAAIALTEEFARQAGMSAMPANVVTEIVRASAGVPIAIAEGVRAWAAGSETHALRAATVLRMSAAPSGARAAALFSTLEPGLTVDVARAALQHAGARRSGLDEAIRLHLVELGADRTVRPPHPDVAAIVLALTNTEERRRAHVALGAALGDAAGDLWRASTGGPRRRGPAELELIALSGDVPPPSPAPTANLTAQQRRIAALAARGTPTREIAGTLFLSPKTVEYHLTQIYRSLGVASKSELAATYRERDAALNPGIR